MVGALLSEWNAFWKGLFVTAHTNMHTDTNATAHLHVALLRYALHISLLGAITFVAPLVAGCDSGDQILS